MLQTSDGAFLEVVMDILFVLETLVVATMESQVSQLDSDPSVARFQLVPERAGQLMLPLKSWPGSQLVPLTTAS